MYYHGTKAIFEQFTKLGFGKHGQGFYFTKNHSEACSFAHMLAEDGSNEEPKVYHVELSHGRLFNTMDINDCVEVAQRLGIKYVVPRSVGGLKEHYYYLEKQLKKHEATENLNSTLLELGFDGIFYEFMEHVILFRPEMIRIIKIEESK